MHGLKLESSVKPSSIDILEFAAAQIFSLPSQGTPEHSKVPLRHLRRKKPRFLNSKRAARVEACRVVPARVVDYVAERALRRATKWL